MQKIIVDNIVDEIKRWNGAVCRVKGLLAGDQDSLTGDEMSKRLLRRDVARAGLATVLTVGPLSGQPEIVRTKSIDDGGSGPYKAVAATEDSLPDFVVYRPADLEEATARKGTLPVLVWANGGCMDSSIHHERLLSEVASHGYVVVAIGTLQMTIGERTHLPTEDAKLLEAIAWISEQQNDSESDYHDNIDLGAIAAGGQSCGGAQVMRVAGDPRIKTYLMFNSGMGPMTMAGASKDSLENLNGPIIYVAGGPSDVAYPNALQDYDRIATVPVAFLSRDVGHGGTFAEPHGGEYTSVALSWLNWQLKGQPDEAKVFLGEDSTLSKDREWTVKARNFEESVAPTNTETAD